MTDPIDPPRSMQTATCRTDGCEEKDRPITRMFATEDPNIVCGTCGVKITDIVAA